ncbi:unnamed protein product [Larinioides sclopetarius]|uniref:Uncharacterized protein n=1 Tax=Larinioides sclopetarius TaxID=280406 RepID=A0AAV2BND6_9ARAC
MFSQVNTEMVIECFLLCIWIFCLRCSATVDGEPTWIDPEDISYDISQLNGKKHHSLEDTDDFKQRISLLKSKRHPRSGDSDGLRHEHQNYEGQSAFVQFYIDLAIIIFTMIALYLLWKILAVTYLKMKFFGSRTERPLLMNQLSEMPLAEGNRDSLGPPDDSEVIIGFDNPLYENYLQAPNEDNIASKDKPPEYETVVFSERNNSTTTSVVRKNPESPPPKYFRNNPMFD